MWLGGTAGAPLNKEWPDLLPYFGGEHAFEVLERGTSKAAVLTVEASEGNLKRLAGKNERQQGEDVREALPGSIAHEFVEW